MASECILLKGGGGGVSSDELTATNAHVLKGRKYVGKDTDDEIGTGSIPSKESATYYATTSDQTISAGQYLSGDQTIKKLTQSNLSAGNIKTGVSVKVNNGSGNVFDVTGTFCGDATLASAGNLINGQVAYGKDGVKYTGTLAVQSILSFSATPYSDTQITFSWKNPAKGAFSGVIIVGRTDGYYPTNVSDGTRWYKGSGNNTTASGTSTVTVSGFTQGTTYYFRAYAYAIKDNAEWVGGAINGSATTKAKGTKTFTSSGTFTVPANVTSIDIFCVGGGAGGYPTEHAMTGQGGGGGGYTATKKAYKVTSGQTFAVTVGAGMSGSSRGGTTSFGSVLSAGGGYAGGYDKDNGYEARGRGGDGGSGGGTSPNSYGWAGGSDGSNEVNPDSKVYGQGQGTTTRAFGESSGTLYAGGGGGSYRHSSNGCFNGAGGAGGGGAGAHYTDKIEASAGSANTGGGGGAGIWAGVYSAERNYPSQSGGSGICIVRWGY